MARTSPRRPPALAEDGVPHLPQRRHLGPSPGRPQRPPAHSTAPRLATRTARAPPPPRRPMTPARAPAILRAPGQLQPLDHRREAQVTKSSAEAPGRHRGIGELSSQEIHRVFGVLSARACACLRTRTRHRPRRKGNFAAPLWTSRCQINCGIAGEDVDQAKAAAEVRLDARWRDDDCQPRTLLHRADRPSTSTVE